MNDEQLEQLKKRWKELASQLSFHNAAEGDMWLKERDSREECRKHFNQISEKLGAAVVTELRKQGDYLL